jgi:hypothetical protein
MNPAVWVARGPSAPSVAEAVVVVVAGAAWVEGGGGGGAALSCDMRIRISADSGLNWGTPVAAAVTGDGGGDVMAALGGAIGDAPVGITAKGTPVGWDAKNGLAATGAGGGVAA